MRIAIVHPSVGAAAAPDESDVLVQAAAVGAALAELGHRVEVLPCTLDLSGLQSHLAGLRADLVFNLVESLDGRGCLIHLVPTLLEALGIPYTGSTAEAIRATSHKVFAKERLTALGLPTPAWIGPFPADLPPLSSSSAAAVEPGARWLIKSLWEHASVGLDETATALCAQTDLIAGRLRESAYRLGGACFAERFIEGREFNLALLAGPSGPQVLPAAEIVFQDFPPETLQIVGYRAKWDHTSYEFHHTPRRFGFPPQDSDLLKKLQSLAMQCWRGFGLNGYARVDFRVDPAGDPWILEINTNPCLSPDAGFAAALQAAGITFTAAVARILSDVRFPSG